MGVFHHDGFFFLDTFLVRIKSGFFQTTNIPNKQTNKQTIKVSTSPDHMMHHFQSKTLLLVLLTLGATSAIPCNNGTTPLVIETNQVFPKTIIDVAATTVQGVPQGGVDTDGSFFNVHNDLISISHEICVPTNACLSLDIYQFLNDEEEGALLEPDKNIFVTYGGQPIELTLPRLSHAGEGGIRAVALVGDCDTACGQDEALLEISGTVSYVADYEYYILDSKTGERVAMCPEFESEDKSYEDSQKCYWGSWGYNVDRFCLPKDGCYTLVAGEPRLRPYDNFPDVFTVVYDGKETARVENFQYEAIDFGADEASCPAPCTDEEQKVEIFFSRQWGTFDVPEMVRHEILLFSLSKLFFSNGTCCFQTWTLTSMKVDESLDEPSGTHNYGDYPLVFHRTCAPRDACIEFALSVPDPKEVLYMEQNGTIPYGEDDYYRLVVDGVVYGEKEYKFGNRQYDDDADPFRTSAFAGCTFTSTCAGSSSR